MSATSSSETTRLVPRVPQDAQPLSDAEQAVLEALRGIAYGQVEVVVHSSRIVQITRSQKLRLGD